MKAAHSGNAAAQNNLALCYESGKGVEKHLTKAQYWFSKSAEQGNPHAQCNLGYLCLKKVQFFHCIKKNVQICTAFLLINVC